MNPPARLEAKLGETHPDTAGKPSGNPVETQWFSTVCPLKSIENEVNMTKHVEQNTH